MKITLPDADSREFRAFLKMISAKLKERRESLDLNQTDVDLAPLPLDVRKYQRMEYGSENFTMQSLYVVCQNLEIHPKDLFDVPFHFKGKRSKKTGRK